MINEKEINELLSLQKNLDEFLSIETKRQNVLKEIFAKIDLLQKQGINAEDIKKIFEKSLRPELDRVIDITTNNVVKKLDSLITSKVEIIVNRIIAEIKKQPIKTVSKSKEVIVEKKESDIKTEENSQSEPKDLNNAEKAKIYIKSNKLRVGSKVTNSMISNFFKLNSKNGYAEAKNIFDEIKKTFIIAPNGIIVSKKN